MARNGCQEFRSYFCIISTNQLVFCDTVEKSRDVKLKQFYISLLCLPIIFMLSSKLWLQKFPALKSLLCPQRGQVGKCLAMPETWALFRAGWKMETKIHQHSIHQRTRPCKVKSFILWVILVFFDGGGSPSN